MLEWDVHNTTLYRLEVEGRLIGIHVGNRVWFKRAQLVELLGEPKHRPQPPASRRGDTTGGEQQGFEFASSARAA